MHRDSETEWFMKHPYSFPRYARLARRAISHYLNNRYDPHSFDWKAECEIRYLIKIVVEAKVLYGENYDWEWLDHSLRYYIHELAGYSEIEYDQSIIDRGYNFISAEDRDKKIN